MDSFLKNCSVPKLNVNEKGLCDQNLTIDEVAKALKELLNDKTPGSDGFTTNFYKLFWPDIKHMLLDS